MPCWCDYKRLIGDGMINIKINGKKVGVEENSTILEACRKNGIKIPTLCYLKEFGAISSCRVCLVKVVGQKNFVTACSYKVQEGMEVITDSKEVIDARKTNIELLLSNHNYDCENCVRNNNCELQMLAKSYNANPDRFRGEKASILKDESSPAIIRDNSKCILCNRCVQVCEKGQTVYAIKQVNRGFKTQIGNSFNQDLNNSPCVSCGRCVSVCPTGALTENLSIKQVEAAIKDKSKFVVVAPAPSVRVGLSEEFGSKQSQNLEEILPSILREIGFDKVFDINFAADLTVVEEGQEFIKRLQTNKNLPLITSCCPGWVDFAKKFYPSILKNISTTKSPQEMLGSVVKTYYAQKMSIDAKNIVVVSIMPCTAKKKELTLCKEKMRDVDYSLTVRELAHLIRKNNINISKLKPSAFDSLLGQSSGAGVIFGSSGGVMEAALRTVAELIEQKPLKTIDYNEVRGFKGTKFSQVKIGNKELNVAVVSGLNNARELMDKILNKEINLDFVEVMACPGGCINGGGMPKKTAEEINDDSYRTNRAGNLYFIDKKRKVRKAHLNPDVQEFYRWQTTATKKAKLHLKHE